MVLSQGLGGEPCRRGAALGLVQDAHGVQELVEKQVELVGLRQLGLPAADGRQGGAVDHDGVAAHHEVGTHEAAVADAQVDEAQHEAGTVASQFALHNVLDHLEHIGQRLRRVIVVQVPGALWVFAHAVAVVSVR